MKCSINGNTADTELGKTLSERAGSRGGPEVSSLKHPELSALQLRDCMDEAEYMDCLLEVLRGRWGVSLLTGFPVRRFWHVFANYRALRELDQQCTLVGMQQMMINEVSMMSVRFKRECYEARFERIEKAAGIPTRTEERDA